MISIRDIYILFFFRVLYLHDNFKQVRKRRFYITLIIAVCPVLIEAQVIDTSKTINTWQLMHNFTRFEEVALDTNTHQIQRDYHPIFERGFAYEQLGILAQAVNHLDFFKRPANDFFLFGRAYEPYLKTPGRTMFFNTRVPFTTLAYSLTPLVDAREENVTALHTQNLNPFTNFGLVFNVLSGRPLYNNEGAKATRTGLFGSYARDRYSIFGSVYYNDFRLQENGGLSNLDTFLVEGYEREFQYPVYLNDSTGSHYQNLSFFLTHKYHLVEKQLITDSLGNTSSKGKTFSLSHQLKYDRHYRTFSDEHWVEGEQYPTSPDYYYEHSTPLDSAIENKLTNVFQLILGDPDYDKISIRAYAGHELRRFGMLSPGKEAVPVSMAVIGVLPMRYDTTFRDSAVAGFNSRWYNDVYIGGHIAGPTTGKWDWVINGKYYLLGYYQNDFQLDATFARSLTGKVDLGLRGSVSSRKPHYFSNHYSSSFFRWDNDFSPTYQIKGEAFVHSNELEMELRAGAAFISNYLYWDSEAEPRVYDKDLLLLSAYLAKHFKLGGFNSENKLLLQATTGHEVLRLPLAAAYTSNYWKQSLFKGALVFDLGFDLYYTTTYRASAYMPVTGVFHLQDSQTVGGYPYLDVFLTLKIARTRIFTSYSNLLQGLGGFGRNYFTTSLYPMKSRYLRFGLAWTFYD